MHCKSIGIFARRKNFQSRRPRRAVFACRRQDGSPALPRRECRRPDFHAAFQTVEAPFRTSTGGFGSPASYLRTSLGRFRAVERRFRNREAREESSGTRGTAFGTRKDGSDLRGPARSGAAVTKKGARPHPAGCALCARRGSGHGCRSSWSTRPCRLRAPAPS